MIQKAILSELHIKLSSWLIFEDQVSFLSTLNITQLCVLSDYQNNNKEDDALQFIDLLRKSQEIEHDIFKTPISSRINRDESPPTPHSVIKVKANCSIDTSCADFKHIVDNGNIYIDKTLFIKAILEDSTYKIAILRPRSWGKSLNMSMLQAFLNPQRGESEEFANLYLFTGGESKKIMKIDDGKYRKFAGKIPTILFQVPEIYPSNAEMYEAIKLTIAVILWEHISSYRQYLEQKISDSSIRVDFKGATIKFFLEKIIDQNQIVLPKEIRLYRLYLSDFSQINICIALNILARMLYMIHNEPVIFIIDDYDSNYKRTAANREFEQKLESF
ncbi:unnamed protein product [Blepharisma stoltei]|uniref:AAA-ATPase-like domain-containing protein n=1 Tax=Blepharisma stoltei TaxID=1481888 RepID=A0AAU9JLE3_9CILI|nr:unnamed protein product [Blepharisma stoltei]